MTKEIQSRLLSWFCGTKGEKRMEKENNAIPVNHVFFHAWIFSLDTPTYATLIGRRLDTRHAHL